MLQRHKPKQHSLEPFLDFLESPLNKDKAELKSERRN